MSLMAKAGSIKATSQIVASQIRPVISAVVTADNKIEVPKQPEPLTTHSLTKNLPLGIVKATYGIGVASQMRCYHTDLKVPSFDSYRRDKNRNPSVRSDEDDQAKRKVFSYLLATGGTVSMVYGGKAAVQSLVASLGAAADVLALAKVEVNLADIPEGKNATIKWRGKPLFVRHRTAAEIETESRVNISDLRDPEHDHQRVQKPEWLVVVGVCTHLGCVPIANAGHYGGYYCPCHGSHYDASGRIRQGPAPANLEVPAYEFLEESLISVG